MRHLNSMKSVINIRFSIQMTPLILTYLFINKGYKIKLKIFYVGHMMRAFQMFKTKSLNRVMNNSAAVKFNAAGHQYSHFFIILASSTTVLHPQQLYATFIEKQINMRKILLIIKKKVRPE